MSKIKIYLVAKYRSKYVIGYAMGYKITPVKIYGIENSKINSAVVEKSELTGCKILPLHLARISKIEQEEMLNSLFAVIKYRQHKYLDLINNATIINPLTKLHFYDRLRGVGPNTKLKIIQQKKIEKFKSYQDFKSRTGKSLPNIILDTIKYQTYAGISAEQRILTSIYHE